MISLAQAKLLETAAVTLATTMATSEALTEAFNQGIAIAKENKITVQNIHFSLFGEPDGAEGLFSIDDVAKWPRVGSEEGKTGNLPYDKYKYKNSEGKEQSTSFFRKVAEAHPIGATIQKERDAVKNREKVPNEYTALSQADADKVSKDLDDDFTAFLSKLKVAVACYQQMLEVNEKLEGIVIVGYAQKSVIDPKTKRPVVDTKTKQVVKELDRSSPQVIEVTDATNSKTGKFFTMTNFARLSVELTLAGEANYDAFITSNSRGTPEEEESEDEGIKVTNAKQFEDGTIAFNHFMNAVKADPARLRELVKYYTTDSPDDRIATLAAMMDNLSILTENKAVKAKIDALDMSTSEQKKAA